MSIVPLEFRGRGCYDEDGSQDILIKVLIFLLTFNAQRIQRIKKRKIPIFSTFRWFLHVYHSIKLKRYSFYLFYQRSVDVISMTKSFNFMQLIEEISFFHCIDFFNLNFHRIRTTNWWPRLFA